MLISTNINIMQIPRINNKNIYLKNDLVVELLFFNDKWMLKWKVNSLIY